MGDPKQVSFTPITPRIRLPGRGVGQINQLIKERESQLNLLASINQFLLSVVGGDPRPDLLVCKPPLEPGQPFDQVIALPTTRPEQPPPDLGLPRFLEIVSSPILPEVHPVDPDQVLDELAVLKTQLVTENNQLLLQIGTDPGPINLGRVLPNQLSGCL
jgi:hypothetical protein